MMSVASEEIRHQKPRINYFSCVKGPINMDNNMNQLAGLHCRLFTSASVELMDVNAAFLALYHTKPAVIYTVDSAYALHAS
jgi:hypothetical protein